MGLPDCLDENMLVRICAETGHSQRFWQGCALTVIAELEGNAEVVGAQQADDILELVL